MKTETIKTISIIILILLVVASFIYFDYRPKYNQKIFSLGYTQAQIDLFNQRIFPVVYNSTIVPVNICSNDFSNIYSNLCGGNEW